MIKNPNVVRETASFAIYVMDKNSQGIASVVDSVKYTPTSGNVTGIVLESESGNKIQELVNLELKFTPSHMLTGDSYILLTLPDLIEFSCTLASTTGMKVAPTCTPLDDKPTQLKFTNPFIDEHYEGGKPLSFIFRNRVLPGSNEMIKGITIKTYMTIDTVDYLVDSYDNRAHDFFAPDQVLFLASEVSTETHVTYTESKFTLRHTTANSVPYGSIIHIQIPP